MNRKLKVSSTAYRILLLLLYLNQSRYNIHQLNEIFSKNALVSRYFSRDVIIKYISTLRVAGYKISKPCLANNYTYELEKLPVSVNLNDKHIKTLAVMDTHIKSLHQSKFIKEYKSFLKKIQKLISDSQINMLIEELEQSEKNYHENIIRYEQFAELIKKIELLKEKNCRVSVVFIASDSPEEKQAVFELKSFKYDKNEVYLSGYNPIIGQSQLIKLSQIIELKQLPTKSHHNIVMTPVIFKLKGQLAKIYRPYENEKITESGKNINTISVTAYVEDYRILLNRLLKYGESCEVIYPKIARDTIIKTINKTLENYE